MGLIDIEWRHPERYPEGGRAEGSPLGRTGRTEEVANVALFLAAGIVAKAVPDGYTLLIHASNIWTIPLLQRNPPL